MTKRRKKYTEEVKGRLALEAIKGIRTLSELSPAYGVHPTVTAQWKRQLIKGAVEVFNRSIPVGRSEQELTAPLYEEIGRLKMEIDWLKKNSEGVAGRTARMDRAKRCDVVDRTPVRLGRSEPIELLLRAVGNRDRREPRFDAGDRPVVSEVTVLRSAAHDRLAAGVGASDQSQAGRATDASNGFAGDIAGTAHQPGASRAPYLPVFVEGSDGRATDPGVVCGHYLRGDEARISVLGGGAGLVQPLCVGVGVVQHVGGDLLCGGVGAGVGPGVSRHLQHRPGGPIYWRAVHGVLGAGLGADQYGWPRTSVGQRNGAATVTHGEVRRHLSAGLRRRCRGTLGVGPVFPVLQHPTTASGAWQTDPCRGALWVKEGGC